MTRVPSIGLSSSSLTAVVTYLTSDETKNIFAKSAILNEEIKTTFEKPHNIDGTIVADLFLVEEVEIYDENYFVSELV